MIPVCEPYVGEKEIEYAVDCLKSGWISSEGEYVRLFEDAFSQNIGVQYGITVSNGTAALETALHAVGVREGDEVIVTNFTIMSCIVAIHRLGAIPILVDIEPRTWNMDVDQIEEKISDKTKAILCVHIYGHPVKMDAIMPLADKYDLKIVEDVAESHGAKFMERNCGSMGDVATFSFYANKFVTTGEGGMVVCDSEEVAQRARNYRNLYFSQQERFLHEDIGFNHRMSSLQAAVGLAQLQRIDETIAKKNEIDRQYRDRLNIFEEIKLQKVESWATPVCWMFSLELSPSLGIAANEVMAKLRDKGIGSRPFFRGMHSQPALIKSGIIEKDLHMPVSEKSYEYGLYLPSGLLITEEDVNTVCDNLLQILNIK